jgi:hypothetical protein
MVMGVDLVAAGATALAAIAAAYSALQSKRAVELQSRPMLALDGVEFGTDEDGEHQFYLWLANLGPGPAQIQVVDLDKRVDARLGVPLNIGSGGRSYVRVHCPDPHKRFEVRLSVYYWDVCGVCYRSELWCELFYFEKVWFQRSDRSTCLGRRRRPPEALHWPRKDYFCRPWWERDP